MRRIFHVLLALAGVFVTFVWAAGAVAPDSQGQLSTASVWWPYAAVLAFGAGGLLHTPVHELGHVLAAKALGLRVLGVRLWQFHFGSVVADLAGTSGHVHVEDPPTTSSLPARMSLFALAGPAANVAVSLALVGSLVADRAASNGLRAVVVGLAVRGFQDAILNLVPHRVAGSTDNDGKVALTWIVRRRAPRANGAKTLVGRPRHPVVAGANAGPERRDALVSAITDDHPDVAVAAMRELLRRRSRWDDGAQDHQVVVAFAERDDIAADVRAQVAGLYSLSLAVAHLDSLRRGRASGSGSPDVRRIEQLAELALAADPASLQARCGMALTRVVQERPAEARALLLDLSSDASPVVQARAFAVRGIAELELGSSDQAREFASLARRLDLDDPVVTLLHARLAAAGVA